jgi:hypothetical protein
MSPLNSPSLPLCMFILFLEFVLILEFNYYFFYSCFGTTRIDIFTNVLNLSRWNDGFMTFVNRPSLIDNRTISRCPLCSSVLDSFSFWSQVIWAIFLPSDFAVNVALLLLFCLIFVLERQTGDHFCLRCLLLKRALVLEGSVLFLMLTRIDPDHSQTRPFNIFVFKRYCRRVFSEAPISSCPVFLFLSNSLSLFYQKRGFSTTVNHFFCRCKRSRIDSTNKTKQNRTEQNRTQHNTTRTIRYDTIRDQTRPDDNRTRPDETEQNRIERYDTIRYETILI